MFDHLNRQISTFWGLAAIIIVSAVFLGLIQVYFSRTSQMLSTEIMVSGPTSYNCEAAYNSIEEDFEEANFCEEDKDCKTMEIEGMFALFGCYKFVNVKTNEQKFYDKMIEYYQHCEAPINMCASVPEVVCVSNKCVQKSDL